LCSQFCDVVSLTSARIAFREILNLVNAKETEILVLLNKQCWMWDKQEVSHQFPVRSHEDVYVCVCVGVSVELFLEVM